MSAPGAADRHGTLPLKQIRDALQDRTERATAATDATLARVDAKATMLSACALGVATAVLALVVARPHIHTLALVAAGGAGMLAGLAAILLFLAVRPFIPRDGGTGFVAFAAAKDGAAVRQLLAADDGLDHLHLLSRLARAKMRRVRRATDLLVLAVTVLIIAVPVGVLAA
uniref:Pycsar system effector family protein n=1 Tax=Nonomuraea sp. CA-251285 TaxID=3240002 RepID=UPI003F4981DC